MDWKQLEGRSGFLAGRPPTPDRVPGLGWALGSLLEERTRLSWGQSREWGALGEPRAGVPGVQTSVWSPSPGGPHLLSRSPHVAPSDLEPYRVPAVWEPS